MLAGIVNTEVSGTGLKIHWKRATVVHRRTQTRLFYYYYFGREGNKRAEQKKVN